MRRRWIVLALVAIVVVVAGCRIDDTRYIHPDDGGVADGGLDAIDAAPGQAAIMVTPDTLGVREGNATTVGVRLSRAPTGSVTVGFSAGGPTSGLTFTPASLTFTAATWAADQPIFIDALEDDDAADSQKVIVFSASEHTGMTVPISITDNDVLGLFVTPPALDVTEGRSGTLQISLTAAPATTTTVTLSSSATDAATVAPSSLTFTGANWSEVQTAAIQGVDDADVTSDAAVVTVAAPGMLSVAVDVAVTDDDILAIVPSATSLTLGEGQASTGFTVALTQLPPSAMTVQLTASDPSVTVVPSTLTFTTMAAQAVTITGAPDVDYADEATTVTLHGSLAGVVDRVVAVAVTDDDTQAIIASPLNLTATERGAPRTFDVRLAYQPETSATVALATLGSTRISLDRPELTFTAGNYATTQRVTVTPLSDNDLVTSTVPIALSTQDAPVTVTVSVAVADADQQTLIATPASLNVDEGDQATFTVNLGFAPAGTVTVTAATGSALLGVTPGSLSFDAATWSTPRTVTLTAGVDADTADLDTLITLSGAAAPQSKVVPIRIIDQTVTELAVTPSAQTIPEGGTRTFVVRLSVQPSGPVVGTIMTDDAAIATVSPTMFTLDANNWSSGVTVTVTGVDDPDVGNDTATITFAAGPSTQSVTANVTDDDVLRVVVSDAAVSVPEGSGATIDVTLSAAPVANTTVTVTAPAGVSPSTATLSFNSSDWDQPQPVVLTAVRDDNITLDATTVSFTPSPSGVAATATVTESVDYTILTGWRGEVGDPGERTLASLHAWRAPTVDHDGPIALPACAQIDKIFAISKSPSSGTIQVGLYTDAAGEPGTRVLDSASRILTPGLNTYTFTGLELCAGTATAFLAVRTAGGDALGIQQLATPVAHCTRGGGGMPGSFPSGSVVCGTDDQPVAVWFVMHAKAACSCTPP